MEEGAQKSEIMPKREEGEGEGEGERERTKGCHAKEPRRHSGVAD